MFPSQRERERALKPMRDEREAPDPFQRRRSDIAADEVGGNPIGCVRRRCGWGPGGIGEETEEEGRLNGFGGEDEGCDVWDFGLRGGIAILEQSISRKYNMRDEGRVMKGD